jgi:hypothetical protein
MAVAFVLLVVGSPLLGGCPKSGAGSDDAGARATGSAAVTVASAGLAEAGAGAATGGARSFSGKYVVAVGSMYVPAAKDWSSVKFKNDDSKLLGEGTVSLSIEGEGKGGLVSGTTEGGPLGAAILDGKSDGTTLTATIRRKDPTDEGLTGTLVATLKGDALEGTMNLAEANAAVVRTATLTASKR